MGMLSPFFKPVLSISPPRTDSLILLSIHKDIPSIIRRQKTFFKGPTNLHFPSLVSWNYRRDPSFASLPAHQQSWSEQLNNAWLSYLNLIINLNWVDQGQQCSDFLMWNSFFQGQVYQDTWTTKIISISTTRILWSKKKGVIVSTSRI